MVIFNHRIWGISDNDTGGVAAHATLPIAISQMFSCDVWCADKTSNMPINYFEARLENQTLALDCNNGKYTGRYRYFLRGKL